jgi:hypothetical protein
MAKILERLRRPPARGSPLAPALLAVMIAGCAATGTSEPQPSPEAFATHACIRALKIHDVRSLPAGDERRGGDVPVPPFSPRSADIARIIGVAPLLHQLVRQQGDAAGDVRRIVLRQRIDDRILLAVLDVQGVLAELDCERARGEHLRSGLVERQSRRTQRYGLAGAYAGAGTAIVSGALGLLAPIGAPGQLAQAIGGTITAYIAGKGAVDDSSGVLMTDQNMLGDVWVGEPRSNAFPPSVWRFLVERRGSEAATESVRDGLVTDWKSDPRLAKAQDREQRETLLFGEGGEYSPETLQLRDALFDLLRARIWLMSQDLQLLFHEVVNVEEGTADTPARGAPRPGER